MSTQINSNVYMAVTILLLFTGTFPIWVSLTVFIALLVNLAYQITASARLAKEAARLLAL